MAKVFWRLDGREFFEENSPALVAITRVPKETKEVTIKAAMQAYRYFRFGAAGIQQAVSVLPSVFRSWFEGGAPIRHETTWNITPNL